MEWSDDFDQALPFVDNPDAELESEAQKKSFIKRGKILAIELQKEFGSRDDVELRLSGGGFDFLWKPNSQTKV